MKSYTSSHSIGKFQKLSRSFLSCLALTLPGLAATDIAWADSDSDPSNAVMACYEEKDAACLEELYQGIFGGPTPEMLDAIYYRAMLYIEEENHEEAKKEFEVGVMFGDTSRSADKIVELIKSGNIEVEPLDCITIKSEECLLNIAQSNSEESGVAYYHLARLYSEADPARAAVYTLEAAELGHKGAQCLLAYGYAQ